MEALFFFAAFACLAALREILLRFCDSFTPSFALVPGSGIPPLPARLRSRIAGTRDQKPQKQVQRS